MGVVRKYGIRVFRLGKCLTEDPASCWHPIHESTVSVSGFLNPRHDIWFPALKLAGLDPDQAEWVKYGGVAKIDGEEYKVTYWPEKEGASSGSHG